MRYANYCNLKLLLIFLVIYGHCVETSIYESKWLLLQYKIIYMFHMPMFAFLSGLFLNSTKDCLRQIKKLLPIYALCQLFMWFCGKTSEIENPWWILWYLLSDCFWALFGMLWFESLFLWKRFLNKIKKKSSLFAICKKNFPYMIFFLAILAGAKAGDFSHLDRTWSASRTIVFFPYFFAGLICKSDIAWEKYKTWGKVALVMAGFMILFWEERIPISFLYHAEGFSSFKFSSVDWLEEMSYLFEKNTNFFEFIWDIGTLCFKSVNGFTLRMVCYGIGSLLSFFLLTNISGKRFPFTKAGADTMPIYLLHAPFVLWIREWELSWIGYIGWSVFFIYFVYKIFQWNRPIFGIISIQRRTTSVSKNIRKT